MWKNFVFIKLYFIFIIIYAEGRGKVIPKFPKNRNFFIDISDQSRWVILYVKIKKELLASEQF